MIASRKYEARVDAVDSLLCVGLDPDFAKLPARFRASPRALFEFGKYIIDETHSYAASFKLNIAFFESRGASGLEELKLTVDYLRSNHPDIPVLCDAKRGDTDNTNAQYAAAMFDIFGFDAITVHPYMGGEALTPFLERREKAIIVLCLNPGGREFQTLVVGERPLWEIVAEMVCSEWNAFGNCMLVVGATNPQEMSKARALAGEMTFLVPGIGPQGGDLESSVKAGLNSQRKGMMIVAARSLIFAQDVRKAAREFRDRINCIRHASITG